MSHDHDIVKIIPSRVNSSNGIINVMRWNNLKIALFLQNNNINSVIKHYYKGKTNHVRLEANYCNVVHNVIELGTCMCNIYCAVFNARTCYYTLSLRIIRVVTYTRRRWGQTQQIFCSIFSLIGYRNARVTAVPTRVAL